MIWRDNGACDFVLDPGRPAPRDRPIWRPEEIPYVVLIGPAPHQFPSEQTIDPDRLPDVIARFPAGDGLHLVIGRGRKILRLRFEPGPTCYGAILLPPEIHGRIRADTSLWFLRWLRGDVHNPSPEGAWLTPFRRHRLKTLLRLLDQRRSGASPRQIAEALIDPALGSLSAAAWADSAERRKLRRWTREAERLVGGGYRDLLHGG